MSICPGGQIPLLLAFEVLTNIGKGDPLVSLGGIRKSSAAHTISRGVIGSAKAHAMTMNAQSMFLRPVRFL